MFERFSEPARRAIVLAQEESRLRGDRAIGSEHVLLALTRTEDVGLTTMLSRFTVDHARLVTGLPAPVRTRRATRGYIPFTAGAMAALQGADSRRADLGGEHITPAGLLLGLLSTADRETSDLLADCGAELGELIAETEILVRTEAPDS